ncbi:MAG: hypothetical protein A2Y07_06355 [Planctomycetes bacterium GWF2_50_10]|nr:MAG: hypothetical protein A2Y07_06355 [Planctomycetes bacterium GWF2_50_10]
MQALVLRIRNILLRVVAAVNLKILGSEDEKMMKMSLIGLVVVSMMSVSAANAGSMAVTFPSQSGWTVSGTAGAPEYQQSNWVNTNSDQSSWGNQYNLVDNSGQLTGAKMDWYASPVWNCSFGAADNDNERMMDSGLAAAGENGKVEINVINIPYASYDVVVYFSSELTNAYVAKYTLGATSVYARVQAMNAFANSNTFTQVSSSSTTNLQGSTPTGNYIVFKNVTGSSMYLTAQNAWTGENIYTYAAGQPWAQVSGFQIVAVPEPVTVALLGLGGLMSVLKRRRN